MLPCRIRPPPTMPPGETRSATPRWPRSPQHREQPAGAREAQRDVAPARAALPRRRLGLESRIHFLRLRAAREPAWLELGEHARDHALDVVEAGPIAGLFREHR